MLNELVTDNCVYPFFIREEIECKFLNVSLINNVSDSKKDIMVLSKAEYEHRLNELVDKKCIDCVNYSEDIDDNLSGHRNWLCLDGTCNSYEKVK